MTELLVPPHHQTPQRRTRGRRTDHHPDRRPEGPQPAPSLTPVAPRTGHLALGLDLTGLGAASLAWTPTADEPHTEVDQHRVTQVVRVAEQAGVDFVAFGEDFTLAAGTRRTTASRLDAARIACRLAPVTSRVGLVPTLDTSYLDPAHVATALATLNAKSGGRAAWQVGTSQARRLGETEQVWSRLGRDVERVLEATAGSDPARPRPEVVVGVRSRTGAAVAGAHADVVRIEALDAQHARALRAEVRSGAAAAGRDPDAVRVLVDAVVLLSADAAVARARLDILADLAPGEPAWRRTVSHLGGSEQLSDLVEAWFADGVVDGFTLIPGSVAHDVRGLVVDVLPALAARGLLAPQGRTRLAPEARTAP